MKQFLSALLLSIALATIARAEIVITNPVAKDIGQSYGFFLGQKYSLEKILSEFPRLAGAVKLAQAEFSAAFGDSINEMDSRMSALSQTEWDKIKASLHRQIANDTGKIVLTQAEAEQFINVVRNRAAGDIPSPIIETLLMFKPRHQSDPVTEFTDGHKQRYTSTGSGKAKGVAFALEAPKSWKALEGNRPNIVTKFVSENGRGLEMFLVLIKTMPLESGESITEADITEILNPKDMEDMLPEGTNYISSGKFTLETLPGYWVRFDANASRGRQSIKMSSVMYTIFYKNRMIQMQGQVAASGGDGNDLNVRYKKFEKLFDLIAQSLVLPQIYGH